MGYKGRVGGSSQGSRFFLERKLEREGENLIEKRKGKNLKRGRGNRTRKLLLEVVIGIIGLWARRLGSLLIS